MNELLYTVESLIKTCRFAFLGSIDTDGFPNIKAMLGPRKREGLKMFYFTTNTSSMRVSQFRESPEACIYFCRQEVFQGVMFKGRMKVLEDAHYKEMIWQSGDTLYYPQGLTDPDYCVLQFTADSGRYYNYFHSDDFILRTEK